MGKVINLEICKKFKFDYTNKWYIYNPASALENDTLKLQWDFDIQTDHLISARRPDLIISNNNNKKKENLQNCGLCSPSSQQNKLEESEKKNKYVSLARELKKLWSMEVTIIPIVTGAFGTVTKGLLKGLKELEVGGHLEII